MPLIDSPAADAQRNRHRLHRGSCRVRFLRVVHSAAGHHGLRATESEQGPRNIDGCSFRAAGCCRSSRVGGHVLWCLDRPNQTSMMLVNWRSPWRVNRIGPLFKGAPTDRHYYNENYGLS